MRAFVTGASGKIGRRLVRALHERGDDVVGLTRTPAGEQVISSAGGRALRGSLADARALEEGVANADEVYHLAGGVRVSPTTSSPRSCSARTRRRPIFPLAPVTNARMRGL